MAFKVLLPPLLLPLPELEAEAAIVVVVLLPCRGVRDADLLSRLSFAISSSQYGPKTSRLK